MRWSQFCVCRVSCPNVSQLFIASFLFKIKIWNLLLLESLDGFNNSTLGSSHRSFEREEAIETAEILSPSSLKSDAIRVPFPIYPFQPIISKLKSCLMSDRVQEAHYFTSIDGSGTLTAKSLISFHYLELPQRDSVLWCTTPTVVTAKSTSKCCGLRRLLARSAILLQ